MRFIRNLKEAHSPRWATPEQNNAIILECCFEESCDETLPFLASSGDVEAHGREIYHMAVKGDFGEIAPYQPPSYEKIAKDARSKRNGLLIKTDHTQLPDFDDTKKNAYKVYRQKLREVPQQDGFPSSIVWPEL